MNKKLILCKNSRNNLLFAYKFCDNKLTDIEYCDPDNIIGNIYVGIVSDVVSNINAAFIGFEKGRKGYYLMNDNTPIFLNNKNTSKVCQSDRILIQVTSDRVKTKDYTVSSNISLTGENVVLTVGKTNISISKKIRDNDIRSSLKSALLPFKNEEYGFILRTKCESASVEAIISETNVLIKKWNAIKEKAMHATAGSIVSKNNDLLRIVNECFYKEFDEIITDDPDIYHMICEDERLRVSGIVRLYDDKNFSLSKLYSLEQLIQDSLKKTVWLKSGAYLVIEHTEALNVIDVNTGKAVIKGKREEIFRKINFEAAQAIALEIRKRNLSGIIIVDFINMKSEKNVAELTKRMRQLVAEDDITTSVAGVSNLGLMEITRKRTKKALHEVCFSLH